MLTAIQVFLLAFTLFSLSRVYLRFKEGVLSPKASLFWLILWLGALIGILMPQTTSRVAGIFGVGRGVDIIVYISLAILYYLVFRIYVMIEDLRREISFLVRHIGIKNSVSKSSKSKKR